MLPNPGVLPITFLTISGELEEILEEKELEEELRREILEFYFIVRDFLNVSELVDENYVVYGENGEDGKFRLKLLCVNPAVNLGAYLKKGCKLCSIYRKQRRRRISSEAVLCEPGRKSGRIPEKREKCYFLFSYNVSHALLPGAFDNRP